MFREGAMNDFLNEFAALLLARIIEFSIKLLIIVQLYDAAFSDRNIFPKKSSDATGIEPRASRSKVQHSTT